MNVLYCGDQNMKDGLLISILSLLKEEPRVLKIFIVTAFIDAGDKKNIIHSVIRMLEF